MQLISILLLLLQPGFPKPPNQTEPEDYPLWIPADAGMTKLPWRNLACFQKTRPRAFGEVTLEGKTLGVGEGHRLSD